jgi:AcrR family transcriptional regulator
MPERGSTGSDARAVEGAGKAARTRTAIIDAALDLFRERGYEATTMRAVAAQAGVSVGNAYYYFDSKEQLIQGFYDRIQVEHTAAARPILDREQDLAERLGQVAMAWIDLVEPYRPFAGKFFKTAAEPTSPLNPFSAASAPAREASIALWREVLEGGDVAVPGSLRDELPELLWVAFMGVVLFWVHDRSPEAAATRALVKDAVPLLVQGIRMSGIPGMEGVVSQVVRLLDRVRQALQAAGAETPADGDDPAPAATPAR